MRTCSLAAVVGMVAALSSGALGQDAPLKGPSVKEERPAGLGSQFAQGKEDRKGPMTERIPMRIYAQAIDKLRGDAAPADLRLSEEQSTKIAAIEREFREAMKASVQKSRQAEGQDQPMTEETRRARLQEMARNAPDPADAQVKVYALLSPAQKKFVEQEVARFEQEMSRRRTDEYADRLLKKKKGEAAPDAPRPEAPQGRERARRIIERLEQLPPQEREQILRRLEEELDRRVGDNSATDRPGKAAGPEASRPPKS